MTLWKDIATSRFDVVHDHREDKRMPLEQAIRTFVRPGMLINPCAMQARPNAALYELCRQFAGTSPAFEVDVIDTTGAGDVFHGAYLAGLVKGWDLRRIATFASAVSAIHCTVLGNRKGIPSMDEVETFLWERS